MCRSESEAYDSPTAGRIGDADGGTMHGGDLTHQRQPHAAALPFGGGAWHEHFLALVGSNPRTIAGHRNDRASTRLVERRKRDAAPGLIAQRLDRIAHQIDQRLVEQLNIRLKGQKNLTKDSQREFVAAYQSSALNPYADVELALTQVANTRRVEDHLRRLIVAAQEAFEISELQHRQGTADLLTVLQAQQTLFSAQDQLAGGG